MAADHGEFAFRSPHQPMQICGLGRHLGFQLAFRAIERDVLAWLQPLQQSHAGIITGGHSLGGALAILSAFELQNQDHHISGVHTFGTPRVGGVDFAVAYRRRLAPVTWRFKWGSDAVTIIPPPPLFIHVCWALNLNFNPSFDLDPISALVALAQRTAQTL